MIQTGASLRLLLIVICFLVFTPAPVPADDTELPAILNTVERFFVALDGGDSRAAWGFLTSKSKDAVVSEVVSRLPQEKRGAEAVKRIRADFDGNGDASAAYWKSLLSRVDAGTVLRESRWEPGEIDGVRASILITRVGSNRAAVVALSREKDGAWRLDLSDTFFREPTGTAIIP